MTALVPEPILQVMAPGLIEDFHASHCPKKLDMKATYEPVCVYYVFFFSGFRINDSVIIFRFCPSFKSSTEAESWVKSTML